MPRAAFVHPCGHAAHMVSQSVRDRWRRWGGRWRDKTLTLLSVCLSGSEREREREGKNWRRRSQSHLGARRRRGGVGDAAAVSAATTQIRQLRRHSETIDGSIGRSVRGRATATLHYESGLGSVLRNTYPRSILVESLLSKRLRRKPCGKCVYFNRRSVRNSDSYSLDPKVAVSPPQWGRFSTQSVRVRLEWTTASERASERSREGPILRRRETKAS